MKKSKGKKKVVVLTPLQKARRVVRELQKNILVVRRILVATNTALNGKCEELQSARNSARHEQDKLKEQNDVLLGAVKLREARIGELTAERDRILRLVDLFTSVQITTHGTIQQLPVTVPSAPAALRKAVETKADSVVQAAGTIEGEQVRRATYRRPMYSIAA